MVVAAMEPQRTPSPQTTSADRRLKRFTERITKARQLPLLELPGVVITHAGRTPPVRPKRSRWIVVQSISYISASKRGKHLILKRMRLTSRMPSPSTSALKVYEEIYSGDPGNL
jgi:hypothetical protein